MPDYQSDSSNKCLNVESLFSKCGEQRVGLIDPLSEDRGSESWHTVTFDPPFPAGQKVVVIPMTQTYTGPDTPNLRIKDVTVNSFQIRIDEVIFGATKADGNHADEIVGWVAYGF